jgi:hypothetical protein
MHTHAHKYAPYVHVSRGMWMPVVWVCVLCVFVLCCVLCVLCCVLCVLCCDLCVVCSVFVCCVLYVACCVVCCMLHAVCWILCPQNSQLSCHVAAGTLCGRATTWVRLPPSEKTNVPPSANDGCCTWRRWRWEGHPCAFGTQTVAMLHPMSTCTKPVVKMHQNSCELHPMLHPNSCHAAHNQMPSCTQSSCQASPK